jgi:hypothetical protein
MSTPYFVCLDRKAPVPFEGWDELDDDILDLLRPVMWWYSGLRQGIDPQIMATQISMLRNISKNLEVMRLKTYGAQKHNCARFHVLSLLS